jgi:hypothetical protein
MRPNEIIGVSHIVMCTTKNAPELSWPPSRTGS